MLENTTPDQRARLGRMVSWGSVIAALVTGLLVI